MLAVSMIRGGVPRLTPDMLARILDQPEEHLLASSVFDAIDAVDGCTATKKSFAEFCGLPDYQLLLTIRSPFQGLHTALKTTGTTIPGYHEQGRISLNTKKWVASILALRPHAAVPMYESCSLREEEHSKRQRVVLERSNKWISELESHAAALHDAGVELVPATISSGTATSIYVENILQNESLSERLERIRSVSRKGQYQRIFCTADTIPALLLSLQAGATHIICPLPFTLAANGVALVLDLVPKQEPEVPPRYETHQDMNDPAKQLRGVPIMPHCRCYTCERHTQAYMHHLLTVHEMNSGILLTIHNLTVVVDLLREYRKRPTGPERDAFVQWMLRQF